MIEIKNLNKEINNKEILTDICFEIYKGDFVSVIGPSGSGKTTLLNILSVSYTHLTLPTTPYV